MVEYPVHTRPVTCSSRVAATRPVGQAVKTPPFHGGNMGSIPVRVTKKKTTSFEVVFLFARTGIERSDRNMPVAYCCHQFKNWWLLQFLSALADRNANDSRTGHQKRKHPLSSDKGCFLFNEIHPFGWVKSSSMMKSPAGMKSAASSRWVDFISSA